MRLQAILGIGLLALSTTSLYAGAVTLTFEGFQNGEFVQDAYNGGAGSEATTMPNYGVVFSNETRALTQTNDGGTGQFGGEPSANTAIDWPAGGYITMDVAGGFTSLSFWYSNVNGNGAVNIYSETGGTNNNDFLPPVVSITLPATPYNNGGGPGGNACTGFGAASNDAAVYCPFEEVTVDMTAFANLPAQAGYSVDFVADSQNMALDNITMCLVGDASCAPQQTTTPEPSTWLLLGTGVVLFGARKLKFNR